jgi:peptide/nickel transport system substrate-binding protein
MEALGATMTDGVWTYNGEPVVLIGLIRTEDERLELGDYFSNQLETVGFTVDRQYKTSGDGDAAPCWTGTDPAEGCFSFYTGGWVSTAISRDAGGNFSFFYTPAGLPWPLFQAYTPTEEFNDISQRLFNNDFTDMQQRSEMIAQGWDAQHSHRAVEPGVRQQLDL